MIEQTTEHRTYVCVQDISFVVDYYWHPFYAGARGDYGMQLEPDEPAHSEIKCVYLDPDNYNYRDRPSTPEEELLEITALLDSDVLEEMDDQIQGQNLL